MYKSVRKLDEIHIITKIDTPSTFNEINNILLYGTNKCCGGFSVGLANGKLFIGNQCNIPYGKEPIYGPELEVNKSYFIEFFYSKTTKNCRIWLDRNLKVDEQNVELDIPSGYLTLGTGCHDVDRYNFGYGIIAETEGTMWESGKIFYIKIYDGYYNPNKERLPVMYEPDKSNITNFEKDVNISTMIH